MPAIDLVLASRSPRRADLLEAAGIPFRRGPFPDVDETLPTIAPPQAARHVAERKARAVMAAERDAIVLAADAIVIIGSEILGKPRDEADACRLLGLLSGRRHEVCTAVAVGRRGVVVSDADVTAVHFRTLTEPEIATYVRRGESLDKAGGYAIQGGAAAFVERVEGHVDTVIGLPVHLVKRLIHAAGGPDLGFVVRTGR